MQPLELSAVQAGGALDARIRLALAHLLAERDRILGGEGFGQAWGADQQGRWIGAVALAGAYTGQPAPVLPETVQRFLGTQAPNGFFGRAFNSLTWWGAGRGLIGLLEYWQVSQDEAALQAATRLGEFYLDHLPLDGKGLLTHHGGHEEGLVALWRATGRGEFLDLARKIPDTITDPFGTPGDTASGQHTHSYLCAVRGWVEVYLASGDHALLQRAEAVWEHVLHHQMWATGGISEGSAYPFETRDETCSVADWLRLSLKLWQATQNPRYLDVAEHVWLNHLSFDQDHSGGFCAFRSVGENPAGQVRDVVTWFCCSMHGLRALLETARFIYSSDGDRLAVNLFVASQAAVQLNGSAVQITQSLESPLGPVRLKLKLESPFPFTLQIRIPAWAKGWQLSLNGSSVTPTVTEGTIALARTWQNGDTLELHWEAALRLLPSGTNGWAAADSHAAPAGPQAALQYGPLVLMLDPSLNIYELFEWGPAELLLPQTADGAPFLAPLTAPILGRGVLAVPDAGFMTLARLHDGQTPTHFHDLAWKLAFLVPVSELSGRWTYNLSRLVPYEVRNDLRFVPPAALPDFQAELQTRFDDFVRQRQADTATA